MENRKLLGFSLLTAVLLAGLVLGAAGNWAAADDEGEDDEGENDTQVENVNEVEFGQVFANVGKFGIIGTLTAVDPEQKTISVNGVTVDVSEAKIVGWRWKKLLSSSLKPWKDWDKDWSLDELKVGDKVRVGGKIQGGKLIARLVVLHAFRILDRVSQCQVDADCFQSGSSLRPAKCVEGKCIVKAIPIKVKECAEEECGPAPGMPNSLCPDGKTTAGPVCRRDASGNCSWNIVSCPQMGGAEMKVPPADRRTKDLQNIQQQIQEILEKIRELQNSVEATVGGTL